MKTRLKTADQIYTAIVYDSFENLLFDDIDAISGSEEKDYQSYFDVILKHLAHCFVLANQAQNFGVIMRVNAVEAGIRRLKDHFGQSV